MAIVVIRAMKSELEALQVRIEQAEREADFATAAELKYGTHKELTDRLTEQESTLAALQGPGTLLKEEVGEDEGWDGDTSAHDSPYDFPRRAA